MYVDVLGMKQCPRCLENTPFYDILYKANVDKIFPLNILRICHHYFTQCQLIATPVGSTAHYRKYHQYIALPPRAAGVNLIGICAFIMQSELDAKPVGATENCCKCLSLSRRIVGTNRWFR